MKSRILNLTALQRSGLATCADSTLHVNHVEVCRPTNDTRRVDFETLAGRVTRLNQDTQAFEIAFSIHPAQRFAGAMHLK